MRRRPDAGRLVAHDQRRQHGHALARARSSSARARTTGLLMIVAEELDIDRQMQVSATHGTTRDGRELGGTTGGSAASSERRAARSARRPRRRSRRCSGSPRRSSASRWRASPSARASSRAAARPSPTAQLSATSSSTSTIARATLEPGRRRRRSRSAQYKLVGTQASRASTSRTRSPASTPTSTTSACRGCSTAASSGRAARAPTAAARSRSSVDESSIKHIPACEVVRKGDFLGVVAPTEYARDPGRGAAEGEVGRDAAMLPAAATSASRCATGRAGKAPRAHRGERRATSTPRSRPRRRCVSQTLQVPLQRPRPIGPLRGRRRDDRTRAVVSRTRSSCYSMRDGVCRRAARAAARRTGARQFYEGSGSYGDAQRGTTTRRGRGAHVAGRRQAGAAAVHALGRARLGQLRPGAADGRPRRRRRERQDRRATTSPRSRQPRTRRRHDRGELLGEPIPHPAPAALDTDEPGGARTTIREPPGDRQDAAAVRRLPQDGDLRAPRRAAVGVRVGADDRRARVRGEDGPGRVPPAEHRPTRRAAALDGALDAVAKAANWQPRSPPRTSRTRTSSRAAASAFGRLRATRLPAVVADIEVNKKTGKITVKHLYAAQDAGLAVNPAAWSRTRCRRALMQGVEPRAARGGRVRHEATSRASTGSRTRSCASRTRRR